MYRSLDVFIYIPAAVCLMILLLFMYIRDKKPVFLFGSFFVFASVFAAPGGAAGILASAFMLYAVFVYRKEFRAEVFPVFAVLVIAAGIFSAYKTDFHGIISAAGPAGIKEFMDTILFTGTFTGSVDYGMNILHFWELVFLILGIIVCSARIKEKNAGIVLAGVVVGTLSLLASGNKGSLEAFAFAAPFYILAAAYGIESAKNWKYARIILFFYLFLSFYIYGFYTLSSVSYSAPGKAEKELSAYINAMHKESPVIFIHETVPEDYYYAYMRSKPAYADKQKAEKAAFIAPVYMERIIRRIFPDSDMKNIDYDIKQSLLPHAVYTVDFRGDASEAEFFIRMKEELKILAGKVPGGNYEAIFDISKDYLLRGVRISEKEKLKNTFVMIYRTEAADFTGRIRDVTREIERSIYGLQESADLYYRVAMACISAGENIRAQTYLKKTMEIQPRWQAPREAYGLTTGRMR